MPANGNKRYRQYYQDGSAARNMYTAAPVPNEFFEKDDIKRTRERERQLLAGKKRAQAEAGKRAGAAKSKRLALIWICACIAAILGISAIHLVSRNTLTQRTNRINSLQTELTEITKRNDVLEAELNDGIDYDAIKDTAMNDYGMVYPEDGQVITYNGDDEGYVKQFKELKQ